MADPSREKLGKTVKEELDGVVLSLQGEAAIVLSTIRLAVEGFEQRTGCRINGVEFQTLEHRCHATKEVDLVRVGMNIKVKVPRLNGEIIL